MKNGSDVDADLPELWRRIVFSICVSNTDDHLRNHGFLLEEKGWKLSPAYDINADPTGTGLSLNVSEDENTLDLDWARSVAEYFRVDETQREEIIEQVVAETSRWSEIATAHRISRGEQQMMEPAFKQES